MAAGYRDLTGFVEDDPARALVPVRCAAARATAPIREALWVLPVNRAVGAPEARAKPGLAAGARHIEGPGVGQCGRVARHKGRTRSYIWYGGNVKAESAM